MRRLLVVNNKIKMAGKLLNVVQRQVLKGV